VPPEARQNPRETRRPAPVLKKGHFNQEYRVQSAITDFSCSAALACNCASAFFNSSCDQHIISEGAAWRRVYRTDGRTEGLMGGGLARHLHHFCLQPARVPLGRRLGILQLRLLFPAAPSRAETRSRHSRR
jgi:hypothetical protein